MHLIPMMIVWMLNTIPMKRVHRPPTSDESDENYGHEILPNNPCEDSVPCGENSFVQQCIAELLDNNFLNRC